MKRIVTCVVGAGLCICGAGVVLGQSPGPSKMLKIYREEIKPGRNAAHERVEAAYARAFSKDNYPYYIGLQSLTGPSEAWFLERYDNYAGMERALKLADMEPLKSSLDSLDAQDGELRSGGRILICTYHEELSYVPVPPDLAAVRYISVNTVRTRPGRAPEFQEMRKLLNAAFEKSGSKQRRAVYAVNSGAPMGTYLILSGMNSLEQMDQTPAVSMPDAFGSENLERYRKLFSELVLSSENTMFAVNPKMSHPPKEYITAAPDFWAPKPAKAAVSAPAPAKGSAARTAGQ